MSETGTTVAQALPEVLRRIRDAELRYGRVPGSVQLLAVSKQQPAGAIRAAHALGQVQFGENYMQEALQKIAELADLDCEWHFIGPLQSNKSRHVAQHCAWLHTLDRLKLAQRLSDQRLDSQPPLNVCLQVNISAQDTKAGVAPDAVIALAKSVHGLPNLRLRGLMTLPAPAEDLRAQREPFAELRALLEDLQRSGLPCDTLSMGMTGDLEAAIAEGATIVRVGTAVFGARPPRR
ncbi:MAG: YggS family pyridoxal phosphate-dependent enzyme [Gammaproteobacteria bacterium]|nr:YggS family pyridoxal phosphate-dependent enzyme [Gammaproteobacteria bacterium]